MLKNPPYHKSERMFKRYEQHIHAILVHFPNKVTFDPSPFSQTTFKCRLRDAMNSLIEYQWPSPIDVQRLVEIRPLFEVVEDAGMVTVRPRGSEQDPAAGALAEVSTTNDDFCFTIDGKELTDETVLFACLDKTAFLIESQVIKKPIKIKNCPRVILDAIARDHDVGISDDTHGFYVML